MTGEESFKTELPARLVILRLERNKIESQMRQWQLSVFKKSKPFESS